MIEAAFREAALVTLREWAECEAVEEADAPRTGLAALLPFVGGGHVAVVMPAETASALAARKLGDDADAADYLGETANLIAGQAKTLLYGTPHHFLLTVPRAVAGLDGSGLWLGFRTEFGPVGVQVVLPR